MPLIGRENAESVLREELRRTVSSHGGLILVAGEGGIGKTALITQMVGEFDRDALVLTATAWSGDGVPGFWPWLQVLRRLRGMCDPGQWTAITDAAGAALSILTDDPAPPRTSRSAQPVAAQPNTNLFRIGDAVTTALCAAAQQQPVIVVIDDLHRADPESVKLLTFVARHSWFERIALVAAVRDTEVDTEKHPLHEAFAELWATARVVELTGLTGSQVGELAALLTGGPVPADVVSRIAVLTGGNPFLAEQTARLWHAGSSIETLTPGVRQTLEARLTPLPERVLDALTTAAFVGREFAIPVVAAAISLAPAPVNSGAAAGDSPATREDAPTAGTAPTVVNSTAATKPTHAPGAEAPTTAEVIPTTAEVTPATADVTPATAEATPTTAEATPTTAEVTPTTAEATPTTAVTAPTAAGTASVAAERAPATAEGVLSAAEAEPAAGGIAPVDLAASFAAAVRARLVNSRGDGRFAFVHDLIREALLGRVSPAAMRSGHEGVLAALERLPRELSGATAGDFAQHAYQAAHSGDPAADERALRYLLAAAADACGRMAAGEVATHLRRALSLVPVGQFAQRGRLGLDLAAAAHDAGDLTEARRTYREVLRLAREHSEPELFARAALGLHELGMPDPERRAEQEIELVDQAHRLLTRERPPSDPLAVRLLAAASRVRVHTGRSRQPADSTRTAETMSAEAVRLARASGDDHALGLSLVARHDALWRPGTAARRLALAEEIRAVADRSHDDDLRVQGFVLRIAALLELGDPRAHTEQANFMAYAERTRLPRPRFIARSRAGALATLAGRFDEAARAIDAAYALGERIGEVDRMPLWLEQRWVLALTADLGADDPGHALSGPDGDAKHLDHEANSPSGDRNTPRAETNGMDGDVSSTSAHPTAFRGDADSPSGGTTNLGRDAAQLSGDTTHLGGSPPQLGDDTQSPDGHAKPPGGSPPQLDGDTQSPGGHAKPPGGSPPQLDGDTQSPDGHAKPPGGDARDPGGGGMGEGGDVTGLRGDADIVLVRYRELGGVYPAVPRLVGAARRGDLEAVRGGVDGVWALLENYPRHFHAGPLVALAYAAVVLDDSGLRAAVRKVLEPLGELWAVVAGGGAVYGPYSYWLGRIAAAEGDIATAAAEFTAAMASARRLRAAPWAEAAERELARLDSGVASPVRSAALRAHSAIEPDHNVFRLEDAVWTLRFAGRTQHLPDAKGLRDLHMLLSHPGQDVAALELLGGIDDTARAARRLGADAVLDERAKAEYRRRLHWLDEEIDRAAERHDDRRAAALDAERAALLDELRRAAGLAGRTRRLGDEGERARKTVSARIRDTLRRIDHGHPELGEHLRACVSLGLVCRYQPTRDIRWAL
ncbi:AAA family ATPase [Nocardia sp. IFM 10818]